MRNSKFYKDFDVYSYLMELFFKPVGIDLSDPTVTEYYGHLADLQKILDFIQIFINESILGKKEKNG